jgi:hypothetical protein
MSLGPLIKVEITPTPDVLAELENVMFIPRRPDAGEPEIHGFYDRQGKLRRIKLRYPDGWRAQINVNARGYVTSSSMSTSLTILSGEADAQG